MLILNMRQARGASHDAVKMGNTFTWMTINKTRMEVDPSDKFDRSVRNLNIIMPLTLKVMFEPENPFSS